jgi:acetyl-CoA carboxylase carboxyl transferase subunit alpha
VISPEGCASILWRDPSKSLEAADAMKLTAKDLLELGIIDEIIKEPLGGAHRDMDVIAQDVKHSIIKNLKQYEKFSREEVYEDRKSKFLRIGRDKGFVNSSNLTDSNFGHKDSFLSKAKREFYGNKYLYYGLLAVVLTVLTTLFSVA